MPRARDAIEVLTNLLYLIEKNAHDEQKVRTFVRQASKSLQILTELHEEETPEANDAS